MRYGSTVQYNGPMIGAASYRRALQRGERGVVTNVAVTTARVRFRDGTEFSALPKDTLDLVIEHRTGELDGRRIAYTTETEFLVQVGKARSAYRTRATYVGNLAGAVHYFNAINIGNGHKKRLVCWSLNKPLLARAFS